MEKSVDGYLDINLPLQHGLMLNDILTIFNLVAALLGLSLRSLGSETEVSLCFICICALLP
ncbi:hypothetical protein L484_013173 [Morus notabilis]|uniref:Uncharacterized protein n=1 Tax=Morus notabilis TaxID=981085 RepID=W9RM84_9ROSA|nr:hypothetical protein L484_013173 [Morus notabilis]